MFVTKTRDIESKLKINQISCIHTLYTTRKIIDYMAYQPNHKTHFCQRYS
jgi:hypothetical protein